MTADSLMSWREPICSGWRLEASKILAIFKAAVGGLETDLAAARLRRLASMRLTDNERLALRRVAKAARGLSSPPAGFRAFRLLVVSNRELSFLAGDLEAAGLARGLLIEVVESGFDAVSALAFDTGYAPPQRPFDAVFLLQDTGAFPARVALLDKEAEGRSIEDILTRLDETVAALSRRIGAPVIVATLAESPDVQLSSADAALVGAVRRIADAVNGRIAEDAAAGLLIPFDLATLAARIGTFSFFDPVRFHQAKIPFSLEASPIVADGLAAMIAAMTGRSGRALVLDLDNTLWGGVAADDGLEGIRLGHGAAESEAFLAFQEFALELRRRGVVLAVCSKNVEEIARDVFKSHPDMRLRDDDIAVFIANFDDKATNLARIATALDLDVSSLVFVDDNPAERERVRSSFPFAMVPEIGDDPAGFVRTIVASGFFEHLPLNTDDIKRASAYQARAAAKSLQEKIIDYDAYLRSLKMELTIAPFDAIGRARIAQLIRKSNQFNLTTKRYTEADVAAIEADPQRFGWQVRLKDRFADHGMISVIIFEKDDRAWTIDSWIMSCRVLQRGIEQAVMNALATCAVEAGAQALIGVFHPTPRNGLVKDFYNRMGFTLTDRALSGAATYRLDVCENRSLDRGNSPLVVNSMDQGAVRES